MGGDPTNSNSCIKYGAWENYGDVDDRFHDLSKKEKRYKFICVDTDKNDCLSFAELTALVDVGLGGAGEAKIEGLALATDDLPDNMKNDPRIPRNVVYITMVHLLVTVQVLFT